ncbi:MAG: hypothetical protein ACI9QD_000654 [Thermoproteota archaeon]|jgi:uncharacterized protein (TIGR02147 family)
MMNCTTYSQFLNKELVKRVTKNPRYSQRAFAKYLGLSPGEMSELLKEKRPLSLKSALKIAQSLGLNQDDTQDLIQMASAGLKSRKESNKKELTQLTKANISLEVFDLISQWHYFAILNLHDCVGFIWDEYWIAKKLGITAPMVREAIHKFLTLEIIREVAGDYHLINDYVLATDGIPSKAIRNYHTIMLEKAIDALESQEVKERDVSGVGMAVDPSKVEALKKEISDFQDKLIKKYCSKGETTEVYQLEVALFKLTKEGTL